MKNLFRLAVAGFFVLSLSIYANPFAEKAHRLESPASLNALVTAAADKKLVLLGEASHGTHEYYRWRDAISRRLIAEHDFQFIVVEGDFASLYELNRYVKHMPGSAKTARKVLAGLQRWPTWMWANEEVVALAEWLREYNADLPRERRIGFYGLDVYDENRSKKAVLDTLRKHHKALYQQANTAYRCFAPYGDDSWAYARAVGQGKPSCAAAASNLVDSLESRRNELSKFDDESFFYLLQNALVVRNAERFYRKSIVNQDESAWNARVEHMNDTIKRLLNNYGENAKGIVWAHNTHVGDASYTTMLQANHQNIGRLTRKDWGREQVFIVGFTTYTGSVIAGSAWNQPIQEVHIPKAPPDSLEGRLYATGLDAFYRIFDAADREQDDLLAPMGNRAIGVVYDPANDARQFVPSIVPLRYDVKVFFAETRALEALQPLKGRKSP